MKQTISAILLSIIGLLLYFALDTTVVQNIDISAINYLSNRPATNSPLGAVLADVSSYGNVYLTFVFFNILVICIFIVYKLKTEALIVALSNVALVVGVILKEVFGRARPTTSTAILEISKFAQDSYPSLHTLYYTVFWGIVIYIAINQKKAPYFLGNTLRWLGIYMIVFVGVSRVYLEVHWVSDVLGGYIFGTSLLIGLIQVYKFLEQRLVKSQPKQQQQQLKQTRLIHP